MTPCCTSFSLRPDCSNTGGVPLIRTLKNKTSFFLALVALLFVLTGCGKKDATEVEPTDPVQRERFRLISKVKHVTGKKRLDLSGQVAADLDKAIREGVDASYTIGSNLTDNGKAYRLYWVDKTFIFEEFTAADAPWEGIQPDSLAYQRRGADPPKPDVPTFTQKETFARGLAWYISDASAGDPPGTVVYGKDIPIKIRLRRGAKAAPAALALDLPTTSGSAMLLMYPDLTNAPADQQLSQTFKWARGLSPGSTVHATLFMVELSNDGKLTDEGHPRPASNPVVVTFRVAVKPSPLKPH